MGKPRSNRGVGRKPASADEVAAIKMAKALGSKCCDSGPSVNVAHSNPHLSPEIAPLQDETDDTQQPIVGRRLLTEKDNRNVCKGNDAHQVLEKMPDRKTAQLVSPSVSVTLGPDDSESIKSANPSDSLPSQRDEATTKPWVSLFKNNRGSSFGMELDEYEKVEGDIIMPSNDVADLSESWGYCLIGHIAGRFPGRKALLEVCYKWGVHFEYSVHESGWLIFKFDNEQNRSKVMDGGPYFIFRRPLLLKIMPEFFCFGSEEISRVPVWVKLPHLPLELWTKPSIGRIVSQAGKPLRTDELTATHSRVSYARALVEVDAALKLTEGVRIVLPNGKTHYQKISYEFAPAFCTNCRVLGHRLDNCKVVNSHIADEAKEGGNEPSVANLFSEDRVLPYVENSPTLTKVQECSPLSTIRHVDVSVVQDSDHLENTVGRPLIQSNVAPGMLTTTTVVKDKDRVSLKKHAEHERSTKPPFGKLLTKQAQFAGSKKKHSIKPKGGESSSHLGT